MSHQDAKAIAEQLVRDLNLKHHPGMVVMILRALAKIVRATKDITIYKALALFLVIAALVSTGQAQYLVNGPGGPSTVTVVPGPNGAQWTTTSTHGGSIGSIQGPAGSSVSLGVTAAGAIPVINPPAPVMTRAPEETEWAFPPVVVAPPQPPAQVEYILPTTSAGYKNWLEAKTHWPRNKTVTAAQKKALIEEYIAYLEKHQAN